ncbi:MAG TPA: hypothetical protein DD625_00875 [Leuconostoc mesenteroides]|nr:hypothetical protein [Leuconostoc mesenteroides]
MKLVFQKLSDLDSAKQKTLFKRFETQEPDYIESFISNNLEIYEKNHLLHTKVLIDEESNVLVGFFCLTMTTLGLFSNYKNEHSVYKDGTFSIYPAVDIQYFAINKEYQKRGIGRTLMNLAFKDIIVTVHQYVGASIVTLTSLDSALGFYKKLEFEEKGFGGTKNKHVMLLTIDEIETILEKSNN